MPGKEGGDTGGDQSTRVPSGISNVLKRDELPEVKDKVAIALMRSIKAMLDPNGIMNPGKVL